MESPQSHRNSSFYLSNAQTHKKTSRPSTTPEKTTPLSSSSQYTTPEDLKRTSGPPPGFEFLKPTPRKLEFILEEPDSQAINFFSYPKTLKPSNSFKAFSENTENFKDLYINELRKYTNTLISEHSSQLTRERHTFETEVQCLKSQIAELQDSLNRETQFKDKVIKNLIKKVLEVDCGFVFSGELAVCERCQQLEKENTVKETKYKELQTYLRSINCCSSFQKLKIVNESYLSGVSKQIRSGIYNDIISLELSLLSLKLSPNSVVFQHLESLTRSIKSLFTITKSLERSDRNSSLNFG